MTLENRTEKEFSEFIHLWTARGELDFVSDHKKPFSMGKNYATIIRRVELFIRPITRNINHVCLCDGHAWICYCCIHLRRWLRGQPSQPDRLFVVIDRHWTFWVWKPRPFKPPYWVRLRRHNILVYADKTVYISPTGYREFDAL